MASKAWQYWLHYTVTRALASQHGFSVCCWEKVERVGVTFNMTSGHKQKDAEEKMSALLVFPLKVDAFCRYVQSRGINFDSPYLFQVVNVALSLKNKRTSRYITWFHMCKHKPRLSWWDACPLSRCFTPHPLRGLFVSCFHAWQLWHRFLPSWPCSLKCNKSWIPRLCCTSIRVLLVADKWSHTPLERGKTSRQQKTAVQSCSAEVKYNRLKPTAPRVVS